MIQLAIMDQSASVSRGHGTDDAEAGDVIRSVLTCQPMKAMRSLLARAGGLVIDPEPIVYKRLNGTHVRLMFPVTGGRVEAGAVVSVVCLYHRQTKETLYAHAMHAGPGLNPLLKHLDGPMASPKAQSGDDGDRTSRRIMEHKRALWDRFLRELPELGQEEAGQRWREAYYWSLRRLYFCSRCAPCKWGSPFFDGPDPVVPRKDTVSEITEPAMPLDEAHATVVRDILASNAWRIEVGYADRGGFKVAERPRLIKELDDEYVEVLFPTNATLLQGGSLVGVAIVYHRPSRSVALGHCLSAGPEPEIQFLKGDVAFGLPAPQSGTASEKARATYVRWRNEAWSKFWLDELERGLQVASDRWLTGFWISLETLFGGNDIRRRVEHVPPVRDRTKTNVQRIGEGDGSYVPFETLERIGGKCFVGHATDHGPAKLRALGLSTMMVNVGLRCNQACRHCHVGSSPDRTEEMSRETIESVLVALRRHRFDTLDISGGAPEMNPHFRYLASEASRLCQRIVDRCNLTIFFEPGQEDLPTFLAKHGIEICASLPGYEEQDVDRQRGNGTFDKTISALRILNDLGYGQPDSSLKLNLVSNPLGTSFPPDQHEAEQRYKRELHERFGIEFNHLFAMNNMPIGRFREQLQREGKLPAYTASLVGGFNPRTVQGLMCRRTISVGWDGRLYDCDFNQALNLPLSRNLPKHIADLDPAYLRSRVINTGPHCFGCTGGAGSSCNGALAMVSEKTTPRSRSNNGMAYCAGGVEGTGK